MYDVKQFDRAEWSSLLLVDETARRAADTPAGDRACVFGEFGMEIVGGDERAGEVDLRTRTVPMSKRAGLS